MAHHPPLIHPKFGYKNNLLKLVQWIFLENLCFIPSNIFYEVCHLNLALRLTERDSSGGINPLILLRELLRLCDNGRSSWEVSVPEVREEKKSDWSPVRIREASWFIKTEFDNIRKTYKSIKDYVIFITSTGEAIQTSNSNLCPHAASHTS